MPGDDQLWALLLSSFTITDPVETPGFLVEDLPPSCLLNDMTCNDLLMHCILSLFIMSIVYGLFPFPELQI